jgi:putative membrane protein
MVDVWTYGDPMGGFWVMAIISALVSLAIAIGVIVLIVLGIRWFVRQERASRPPAPRSDDPLEVLRQRYARGEIDEEEYERRRRVLGG